LAKDQGCRRSSWSGVRSDPPAAQAVPDPLAKGKNGKEYAAGCFVFSQGLTIEPNPKVFAAKMAPAPWFSPILKQFVRAGNCF